MTALLLASAGVLTVAAITSVVLAVRSGETRVALLAGVFLLLGVSQGVALLQYWGQPLALDLPTAAASASLAAGLLGLAAVIGTARTLGELVHAEELHWESMESVRELSEFAARRDKSLDDRLPRLLERTCRRFDLEIGLVSRVHGDRYEVLAIHAPPEFPVGVGSVFALDQTPCRATLELGKPIATSKSSDSARAGQAGHGALDFETYLASAIQVGDESFGTLVFASTRAESVRLTATHKNLVHMMSQWIGWEFEQRRSPQETESPIAPRVHRGTQPKLRVDALLRRIARRVRSSVPKGIEIEVNPGATGLPDACEPRLPLEAILMSLAHRAAAAMPKGGILRLEADAPEPAAIAPGLLPAVAPSRYLTLAISESSGGIDPDAIARAFENGPSAEIESPVESRDNIPLSVVYRLLKRAGGDLSVPRPELSSSDPRRWVVPLEDGVVVDYPAFPGIPLG